MDRRLSHRADDADDDLQKLAPVSTTLGALQRLRSLGYGPDPDGDDLPQNQAVLHFQADHQIPLSNKLDAKTTAKLKEVYGS